jgi:hypothetical protein
MKKLFLAAAVLSIIVSVCAADDLNPPPWRGLPGTTHTEWQFNTPNPQPLPDFEYNPYNRPGADGTFHGAQLNASHTWLPGDPVGGRQGIWQLSGSLDVFLWNRPEPNPNKYIWVQVTWKGNGFPYVIENDPFGQGQAGVNTANLLQPDGWTTSTFLTILPYNPPWERLLIQGGDIFVDQLVIDTYCVPEPSTYIGLIGGLGSLLAFRRRKA